MTSLSFENNNTGSTKLQYDDTSANDYVVTLPKKSCTIASTNEANISYKSAPVTVTSWSYVTTTITLNVASHTFVAGDYIEVGGLTATTNIPNGVHLVTSVTATTIVFTYALTPTGTAGVSSATVKGYMTTNGRASGIGVAQTRQNVLGSRAIGTTYTNSTGKPIYVNISLHMISGQGLTFTTGGLITHRVSGNAAADLYQSISAIIMNGETYTLAYFVGSGSVLDSWVEIR